MRFISPARTKTTLTASLLCVLAPASAFCAPNSKAMREALVADYPLTRVGMTAMAQFDYTRITQPGAILAVRLPGIYADLANTQNVIVNTNLRTGSSPKQPGSPPLSAAAPGTHVRSLQMKRCTSPRSP